MLTLVSFLFFTALVAVIAYLKTRREDLSQVTGYFLAGRSLTWTVIAGSLFLTNISAEQLTGLNANAFSNGANVMAWETMAALALIALAFLFLPRYLRSGISTIPQFLENRFGKRMRVVASLIFIYAIVIGFLPFVLYAGAITLGQLFDISGLLGTGQTATTWLMVIAIGVIGGIYAVFGGLKAVAVSDSINGIGLLIAGLLVPILGLYTLGDGDFGTGFHTLVTESPERMNAVGLSDDANIPWYGMISGVIIINLFYWCTNQAIVQRALGAKNLAESQKGVLAAGFLKIVGVFMLVLPGIIAYHLFQHGLLDIPSKPGSDALNADTAYPVLVRAILPTWLTGFFCAAMFGAILSSFNSGVNSLSTLISLDLYKQLIRPDASDRQTVAVGRLFAIVTIVLCIVIAPFIASADSLYTLMRTIMAVINVPIFTVVLFGVISKRAPALAGYLGLAFGMAFFYVTHFVLGDDLGFVQVHWLVLVGLNFVLMLGVMSLVRYLKPLSTPFVLTYTREVDVTPWRYARHASWALVALLVLIYAALSPLGLTSSSGSLTAVIGVTLAVLLVLYGLYRLLVARYRRLAPLASKSG
ncbi:solute:sodium symporter family transporter [Halomonas sp. McH1-25]|uniref:solute:sodium symporter family transporter n=1 Tax=unclassified Halomonas TaxID=2609666 RepID=UPI001EF6ADD4|nr:MULTISPECIES: solute:sodium symporter family transporter [unclassified Halomonas]MCG7599677.1 solute:sodium symporter family transporter [Halomonas sp. McH1-25]MCP1344339.1 solute:sodium symporter family transporter [Halomonas sp. FL8]MCP1362127.1 solute:sodium symporter family transporter [Halomonas sp. BBD45]MCP1365209.1 solute:sodium symporter family transporter [Halomonas sp. BBD48]